MKELSIEDKAKRYDEALKSAIVAHKDEDRHLNATLERIFPELKESEDERIRKALIHNFKEQDGFLTAINGDVTVKSVLAWLEKIGEHLKFCKTIQIGDRVTRNEGGVLVNMSQLDRIAKPRKTQGEQKSKKVSLWKHWKDGIAGNGGDHLIYLVKVGNTYQLTSCIGFECDYIELSELDSLMLDKQGESNPYSGVSFEYNGHIWGMCARDNGVEIGIDSKLKAFVSLDKSFIYPIRNQPIIAHKSAMDTTNEENIDNDNNVGPEFHEGDWVIYNKDVCQIVKREEGCNKLVTQFGIEKELVNERNLSTARLWNIQDAKEGDVLVCGVDEKPFIFKGLLDPNHLNCPVAYCGIDPEDHFCVSSGNYWWTDDKDDVRPATKEQSDILFAKMKDAGYEWGADKKELKKIEQEPENYKRHVVSEMTNVVKDYIKQNSAIEMKSAEESLGIDSATYNKIVDECLYGDYSEQISTWSEEDEDHLKDAVWAVEEIYTKGYGEEELVKWLESLKDRVGCEANCTTTWKPSKEQMEAFIYFYERLDESGYISPYDNNSNLLYSLLVQLDNLMEE